MNSEQAYIKCEGKINKKLEPYFIKDPHWSFWYAKYIIKGRWIEAEQYIIKSPCHACLYARDMIKNRWEEAESTIATDSEWTYYYAKEVIKGKLPENMHNTMLIHADDWSKLYFKLIS